MMSKSPALNFGESLTGAARLPAEVVQVVLEILWSFERYANDRCDCKKPLVLKCVPVPDKHWWTTWQKECTWANAIVRYRELTMYGRVDALGILRVGLHTRRQREATAKWRWLAFRVCRCRGLYWTGMVPSSAASEEITRTRYSCRCSRSTAIIMSNPLLRHEDICDIYKTPVHSLCFRDFDIMVDCWSVSSDIDIVMTGTIVSARNTSDPPGAMDPRRT